MLRFFDIVEIFEISQQNFAQACPPLRSAARGMYLLLNVGTVCGIVVIAVLVVLVVQEVLDESGVLRYLV